MLPLEIHLYPRLQSMQVDILLSLQYFLQQNLSKSVSTQISNIPLTPVVPTPPPSPIPAPAPSPEDPMRAFNASNNAKIEQQLNTFCTNVAGKIVEIMRELQNSMVVAAAIVAASKESTKNKGAVLF